MRDLNLCIPFSEAVAAEIQALQDKERVLDEALSLHLQEVETIFDRIGQPAIELKAHFAKSGCEQMTDLLLLRHLGAPAAFIGYIVENEKEYFLNRIIHDGNYSRSPMETMQYVAHEGTHAIAYNNAPILHANVDNMQQGVVMAPSSMALVYELIEKDAHAKQVWFAYQVKRSQFNETDVFFRNSDLKKALIEAGNFVMRRQCVTATGQSTIGGAYHTEAFNKFKTALPILKEKCKNGEVQLVRMDKESVATLGNTHGPNIFVDDNGPLAPDSLMHFSKDNQRWAKSMVAELGIKRETDLPTFTDALKARGQTPEQFLADCRSTAGYPFSATVSTICQPI